MGPPASGKSTQAKIAAETLKTPIISAEELIAANPKAFSGNPAITGMDPRTNPAMNGLFELQSRPERTGPAWSWMAIPRPRPHRLPAIHGPGRPSAQSHGPPTGYFGRGAAGAAREKVDQRFEQLLKDYHRETDMLKVYFPTANVVHVDATGTPEKVSKRVKDALARSSPRRVAADSVRHPADRSDRRIDTHCPRCRTSLYPNPARRGRLRQLQA